MKEIFLKAIDNYELCLHIFEVENPKGYIQIIHGMEEHQGRYEYFVEKLNNDGYTVITSDMRGHGKNATTLGFFAEKNGYKLLIDDYKRITNYIKETYNISEVIMFAHSMGTIILRNLLQTESHNYKKVILSGYPNYNSATSFGIFIASFVQFFKGAKAKSKLVHNLSVGVFNKKIKKPKTNVDWVSKNEENVNNYLEDDLCGFGFTVSALNDLFHLVKLMHKVKRYKNVEINLPLFMIRGSEDPSTGYEKGKKDSIKTLKKAGFKNIIDKDYIGYRHEILNEEIKDEVILDIIEFINS